MFRPMSRPTSVHGDGVSASTFLEDGAAVGLFALSDISVCHCRSPWRHTIRHVGPSAAFDCVDYDARIERLQQSFAIRGDALVHQPLA